MVPGQMMQKALLLIEAKLGLKNLCIHFLKEFINFMELSSMYSAQLLSLYITSRLCNKGKAALALHYQTCHAQTGLLSGILDLGH